MEYTIGELEAWCSNIEELVSKFGLDCYEQEFEIINYKDMLSYEAYVGMPSRYPHWSFGKAYEKNKTLYRYNLTGLPYEMVINSSPCLAYLMKENTKLVQILTIAHVFGHNDFFKNNRLFKNGLEAKYVLSMFKSHGDTIREYVRDPSIGYSSVEKILDAAHAIKLQTSRVIGEKRIPYEKQKNNIIEDYKKAAEKIQWYEDKENIVMPDISKIPLEDEEDLLYFILEYGELQEWEKNIVEIVKEETNYFMPQIETKIMNEGWASFWHYRILNNLELEQGSYLEFIKVHNSVIAPMKGMLNPYFLGFKIFEDIEKRFGTEKIFEVRALERDESFIRRYLTKELCNELNLFSYEKIGSDYLVKDVADEEGWKDIRDLICKNCGLNLVPHIKIIEMDKKDRSLHLEQVFDGRELNIDYAKATLKYIHRLWGNKIILNTNLSGKNISIICEAEDNIYLS